MRNTTTYWIIGILIFINLITLGTFWFGKNKTKPQPHRNPGDFLKTELSLNDKQFTLFRSSQEKHIENSRSFQRNINIKRRELFESFAEKSVDTVQTQILLDELSVLYIDHEKEVLNHFHGLSEIVDEDQAKKLKRIFLNGIRKQERPFPSRKGQRVPPRKR